MGDKFRLITILGIILAHFSVISADSYSVVVGTEEHVNLVDSKFLSFTIDPKYLFSSSEKYNSKECICMATSLTPAYIRIAGPSTSRMTFKNTTIAIEDTPPRSLYSEEDDSIYRPKLAVSHGKWEKFVHWAKSAGFDLVFALNNQEKNAAGAWDPNTALSILTMADEARIGNIFWQLGYECKNQSIEEYLNDCETLRVITETFPAGAARGWRVVAGDVTPCLQAHSKSDFKDYVTLSNDMMDAIFLNGNSSSQELERMLEKDRYKLLKLLSTSATPLWLTERSSLSSELERAADWMTSLGYSARNGFSVHYRELKENELYEPTLSFYMALLFKNLVGERVLSADIEASQAILFAHCTSLRRKPVPGAVSFYGANMDDEPARFSIKMSKQEKGGDIMQFILGHDRNGNIVVNGRAMHHEGDIRPVVKRVRPYKTLLINLPPKSFGFWVLANTQVAACFDVESKNTEKPVDNISVIVDDEEDNFIKSKRSLNRKIRDIHDLIGHEVSVDGHEEIELEEGNSAFKEGMDQINQGLKEALSRIHLLNTNRTILKRSTRQTSDEEIKKRTKPKKYKHKFRHGFDNEEFKNNLLNKFAKISKDHFPRYRNGKLKRLRGIKRSSRVKSKRNLNDDVITNLPKSHNKGVKIENNEISTKNIEVKKENFAEDNLVRNRRSINPKNKANYEEAETSENEIDVDDKESLKVGKILHKPKKLSDSPSELKEKGQSNDYDAQESNERMVLKTKVTSDGAVIDISDKSHFGLVKSTLEDVLSLLADFNKNINRFWAAMTSLE